MPKNILPILAPVGGLDYSAAPDMIGSEFMTDCLNVRIEDNRVVSRNGLTKLGQTLDSAITGIYEYETFAGVRKFICFTANFMYQWDTTTSQWVVKSNGKDADDCEAGWTANTNVTVTHDTTYEKEGSACLKASIGAAFTTGIACYHNDTTWDTVNSQDWSGYDRIGFWVLSTVAQAAGDLQLVISNAAACGSEDKVVNIPALAAKTANVANFSYVVIDLGDMAALTSVDSIGLKVATDNGACDVYIDDIRVFTEFAGTDSDFWTCMAMRDTDATTLSIICTNAVDKPLKWDGSVDAINLEDYASSDLTAGTLAKVVENFKSYCVFADVYDGSNRYYQRIQWSDTQQLNVFTTGNSGSYDLAGSDRITSIKIFHDDYLAIARENSIWLGWATGDSDIFQFDNKVQGRGCVAGKTFQVAGDKIIYLGKDDIYEFDGNTSRSIGRRVRNVILDSINPSNEYRSFAISRPDKQEYWLFTPRNVDIVATPNDIYPYNCWVYRWDTGAWTRFRFSFLMTAGGEYIRDTTLKISQLQGKIDQLDFKFDDRQAETGAPQVVVGDSNGNVYIYDLNITTDNATTYSCYFTTKLFSVLGSAKQGRFNRMDLSCYYDNMTIHLQSSETPSSGRWMYKTSTGRSTYKMQKISFRTSQELIGFKFTAGGLMSFNRANLYWRPGGRI